MTRTLITLLATAALLLPSQLASAAPSPSTLDPRVKTTLDKLGLSQLIAAEPSTPTPDPRVKTALDKLGLKYQVDKDGDFKIVMKTSESRTQLAWILSRTQKIGSLEIRRMFSAAYKSSGPISESIANQLLMDSSRRKLGAWQAIETKNTHIALFISKIAANGSKDDLLASLQITMATADEMEQTLTSKDEF